VSSFSLDRVLLFIGLPLGIFVGLPLVMFAVHMATLSEGEKQDLTEAAKDLNGRIYTARIVCGRGRKPHLVRVHGRSRDDARQKIESQVRRCDVEMLETESDPIWQEALRSARQSR
jgi:hypothetical protein